MDEWAKKMYKYNGILFSNEKQNGTRGYHAN
jgi:hypothetical protein